VTQKTFGKNCAAHYLDSIEYANTVVGHEIFIHKHKFIPVCSSVRMLLNTKNLFPRCTVQISRSVMSTEIAEPKTISNFNQGHILNDVR